VLAELVLLSLTAKLLAKLARVVAAAAMVKERMISNKERSKEQIVIPRGKIAVMIGLSLSLGVETERTLYFPLPFWSF
jgi:hypothetical protein